MLDDRELSELFLHWFKDPLGQQKRKFVANLRRENEMKR